LSLLSSSAKIVAGMSRASSAVSHARATVPSWLAHAGSDGGMVARRRRFGRWALVVLGLLIVASATGSGTLWLRDRSRRRELAEAREAMNGRRYGVAQQRLERVAGRWTSDGEVLVLLGECQAARGKREDALATWAKVPPTSPFFDRASLQRATHLINSGRYAPAEMILEEALAQPARPGRYDLERALSRLYRFEGRQDDVRRVDRASWSRFPDPARILKELYLLDHAPLPAESLQLALNKADDDDDRVWLGRANHALATGRLADAARWLERCVRRRAEDPVVSKSRLELAMATDDLSSFWKAVVHVPVCLLDVGALHALRAWLAARAGDRSLERRELTALLEHNPGDTRALERLAVLATQAGQTDEANLLRLRKAKIDRAHEKIRLIVLDEAPIALRADELAKLMTEAGREFDARAWAIVSESRRVSNGPDAGSTRDDGRAPLASSVMAAAALSEPFATYGTLSLPVGPMLADRLDDLRANVSQRGQSGAPRTFTPQNDDGALATVQFVDDAEPAKLHFILDNGQSPRRLMPETNTGGVGLLDFDGDGWLDVYCVQGGAVIKPDKTDATIPSDGDRLFRNRGDGTFEDVTKPSGIARIAWGRGFGLGVSVADYDNDGRPDLFVTRLETYCLYHNRGDGTFEDITEQSGLGGRRDNPSSAAFADLDNDGDLDLYVCHYMLWDPVNPPVCFDEKKTPIYCSPEKVAPAPDHVFRNDGGRFVDVTAQSGCAETYGRGLGVVAADLDDDNLIDLYVANDGTANYFYHNLGNFRFEEIGQQTGLAANAEGGYRAGMGVACGDIDGDGRPELMVTNFYGEGATFYQNLGACLFADRSSATGIGLATRYLLGFGIAMFDVSNDGRPDVMITNGHVIDNRPFYRYAMPCRVYENRPDGRLVDISAHAGPPWEVERLGRGLAAGDVDNDGLVDALVVAQNGPLAYFHNRTKHAGHFVALRLEGTKSNRDGIGARVTVMAGGRRQVAQRTGGGSYQSANDHRLHFGLGKAKRVEQVEVRWPAGRIDRFAGLDADSGYLLREGASRSQPLAEMTARSRRAE
jgi:thioredoxin-like negative regulator of GroEL